MDLRIPVYTIKLLKLLRTMLKGKKTYVVATLGILTSVAAYLTGDASLGDTLQHVFEAVLAMTIRSGITTKAAK